MLGKRSRFELNQQWLDDALAKFPEEEEKEREVQVELDPDQVTYQRKVK